MVQFLEPLVRRVRKGHERRESVLVAYNEAKELLRVEGTPDYSHYYSSGTLHRSVTEDTFIKLEAIVLGVSGKVRILGIDKRVMSDERWQQAFSSAVNSRAKVGVAVHSSQQTLVDMLRPVPSHYIDAGRDMMPLYPSNTSVNGVDWEITTAIGFLPSGGWRLYETSRFYLEVGFDLGRESPVEAGVPYRMFLMRSKWQGRIGGTLERALWFDAEILKKSSVERAVSKLVNPYQ